MYFLYSVFFSSFLDASLPDSFHDCFDMLGTPMDGIDAIDCCCCFLRDLEWDFVECFSIEYQNVCCSICSVTCSSNCCIDINDTQRESLSVWEQSIFFQLIFVVSRVTQDISVPTRLFAVLSPPPASSSSSPNDDEECTPTWTIFHDR